MAPHATLAGALFMTANAHLIYVPIATACLHYLVRYNHLKKATLYMDMNTLGKNESYMATFEKVREILLTDERFEVYIEQKKFDEGGEDPLRQTTLLFHNPTFMPFAYKMQGMTGKLDEERQRYCFTCVFIDLVRNTQGRVNALIIFNAQKEAYFESLTVNIEQPRFVEFKLTESTDKLQDVEPNDPRQWNRPKMPKVE